MEKQPNARMCFVCGIDNPIGPNLGGRTLEETALSILARIVAMKNGRTGRSLRDTMGWIGRYGRSVGAQLHRHHRSPNSLEPLLPKWIPPDTQATRSWAQDSTRTANWCIMGSRYSLKGTMR